MPFVGTLTCWKALSLLSCPPSTWHHDCPSQTHGSDPTPLLEKRSKWIHGLLSSPCHKERLPFIRECVTYYMLCVSQQLCKSQYSFLLVDVKHSLKKYLCNLCVPPCLSPKNVASRCPMKSLQCNHSSPSCSCYPASSPFWKARFLPHQGRNKAMNIWSCLILN